MRPYLSTPEGFTGARGRCERGGGGRGVDSGCGAGAGAGAAGADGVLGRALLVGAGTGVVSGREEKRRAVSDAPAAAEPAAMRASVDLDILAVVTGRNKQPL